MHTSYEQLGDAFGEALAKLMQYLAEQGVGPDQFAGPFYAVYHSVDDPNNWDYSIGIPISGDVRSEGDFTVEMLPGGKAARTTLEGSYEGLKEQWEGLMDWLKETDHKTKGDPWESYRVSPPLETDPSKWETDIYWVLQ
jgi:effector-binding domain-containing protein